MIDDFVGKCWAFLRKPCKLKPLYELAIASGGHHRDLVSKV